MATYAGPAFGKAVSFWFESYGLLSAAPFLYHVQKYTMISFPCKMPIYIDNKGIAGHITEQLKYLFGYSYNTLEPDWDIVAQSAVNLCVYGLNLTIHHVKSHQDNDRPYEELDIPAKINVEAE
eukprot:15327675-Ditylum_brightwellii.AAC.1